MRKCPNGHDVSDNVKFCPQCGAEVVDNNKEFCSNCGSERKDNEKFCSHCGTPFGNVPNNAPIIIEEEDGGGFKKYLPYVIGAIVLIAICGGWWLLNSKESIEPLETTLVSFKKTAPGESFDVEAEINVDFPQKGNANLIKNITSFLIDALTNEYRNNEDAAIPHYNGDISDGQAIVDFYGDEKIKELQNQGIGDAKISILKTYETDKIVSYTVDFGGSNGGVGFGAKYGASFNKADGTTIQVIKAPNDGDFKNYLISKVKSHLRGDDGIVQADESELEAHPYPKKDPYLTKDGVCFIYQKYEIGSGALDEVELTIPYNAMKPYMSEIALSLVEVGEGARQDAITEVEQEEVVETDSSDYYSDYEEDTNSSSEEMDYDWLQGHWVYEQGNYKGHIIIQGNSITQYSSMNPERYEGNYRIEGNEIRAKLIDGMDLTVKIDFANKRLDYGDGNWMHKTSSSDSDYSSSSSSSSLTTEFQGADNVVGYLANHTFTDGSGLDIRFDSNGGIYIDNDYAGVVSVLTYNSTSALLRYRGGAYGEGKIAVTMDGNGRMRLTDPVDGTVWYQK